MNFSAERAELQSVLDSGIFARSPNLQRFLVFVCDKYFAGEVNEIKEYLVAVEALGRPADFDQKRDSIVRVEAHRLRKRLDEFYRGQGADHPIRIQLASGSYVPQFVRSDGTVLRPPAENKVRPSADSRTKGPASILEASLADQPPTAGAVPHEAALDAEQAAVHALPEAGGAASSPQRRRLAMLVACACVVILAMVGAYLQWYWDGSDGAAKAAVGVAEAGNVATGGGVSAGNALLGTPEHPQPIRILAGSPLSSYVDRFGNTWTGDAFFQGGTAVESKLSSLHFTALPELYQYRREGEFSYSIPLAPGVYELRLHFAEPIFGEENLAGGGETSRLFEIFMNGQPLLREFDIVADAFGAGNADVKVFKNVRPGPNGRLQLDFRPGMHESPVLSAIEVIPCEQARIQAVRVVANERGFTDRSGHYWSADHHVNGGRFVRRSPIVHPEIDGSLFQGERYGNFTYMIPVAADGKYCLRLYFCERWWGPETHAGGGAGSRRFDVFVNGRALLSDFDIYQQAGGNDKPIVREFSGIRPNAQGKVIVQFIPRVNYAMVNALELLDESP